MTPADSSDHGVQILLPKGWRGGLSFKSPPTTQSTQSTPAHAPENSLSTLLPAYLLVTEVSTVCFSSQDFLRKHAGKQLDNVSVGDKIVKINGLSVGELVEKIFDDGQGGAAALDQAVDKTAADKDDDKLSKMMMDMTLDDISKRGPKTVQKKKSSSAAKASSADDKDKPTKDPPKKPDSNATAAAVPDPPTHPYCSCRRGSTGSTDSSVLPRASGPSSMHRPHRLGSIGKFDDAICPSCDFYRMLKQFRSVDAGLLLWIKAVKDDDETRITLTVEHVSGT